LVGSERNDDRRRRCRTRGQRIGERAAYQGRWIVEELEHQAFGRHQLFGGQIGTKIGARQRARRLGALISRRSCEPLQEIADDRHREPHDQDAIPTLDGRP